MTPRDAHSRALPNGDSGQVVVGYWDDFAKWHEVARLPRSALVTFDLPDGQHIKASAHANGTVGLSAYPSTPIVTANCNAVDLRGKVPSLDEMADGVVPEAEAHVYGWASEHVIKPDDQEWGYADKQAQTIATEFRARRMFHG